MTAYALFLLALWHLIDLIRAKADTALVNGALGIVIALTVQIALGVLTLLHMVPISLALMHQAVALVVLTQAIAQAWRLSPVSEVAVSGIAPASR
jgi:cytochrome c oxidase assembly protein subunit 15